MNSQKYTIFEITANDSDKRVDNVIRKFLSGMPLKSIFKAIRSGDIRVNEKKVKQNHILKYGDRLMIYSPLLGNIKDEKSYSKSLNKKRIIFENSDILIYNKPKGQLVHGDKNSLDKEVRTYLKGKAERSLSFNPGPLHRLDRNTAGLITFSVSLKGARTFTSYLQDHLIEKTYLTIVDGTYTQTEKWQDKLERDETTMKSYSSESGKNAVTHFIPLLTKNNKTAALIKIETGRTHQIRVQCSLHDRPLTGDRKYNNNSDAKEYYLTAICLTFPQNSDIVNKRKEFFLSLKSDNNTLLNRLFNSREIDNLETLIRKELE